MAYTNRQKANFYLEKYNEVYFSTEFSSIYWGLYKAYDSADKLLVRLKELRKRHPSFKPLKNPLPKF